ncbi:MAG: type II toxin-antitoxin system RelB/DinJ family antitoxin [Lamprobacter sp.]|uniref:type II toxin-antitoxin system RelB/DinJ family antitoxin n=1 Tax=Lamprobacter sp. TaxID=3100796 RepID=UPI002B262EAB|nr:type II toxin-antitoxin system RelB/DinJ family antitoxin [Lamprobacter sp.]MEA3643421.1 type II toxin-antitoxin system RelB/DinJ family antitoxin [Lamprobacter sp.]
MPSDTVVRARVDQQVKAEASEALEAMGLSMSDAIRLLLVRVAKDKTFPFEIKVPNATTRQAIAELEADQGKPFNSVEALMADLREDD